MARCEGTTRSGQRCKLDAQPGSRFCHLHGEEEEERAEAGAGSTEERPDWEDIFPLFVAGVVAAGMIFFLRSFGKWIPRP
jgi:hypothetical protein